MWKYLIHDECFGMDYDFIKKNMTKITRPEYCWGKTVKTTFELGSLESYVLQPTRYEAKRQKP